MVAASLPLLIWELITHPIREPILITHLLLQGSAELQDLLPPPHRPACAVLEQLAAHGLFPPEQLENAEVLAADFSWARECRSAPLAAALLMAFSRAGGMHMSAEQAAATVVAAGMDVSVHHVHCAFKACMAWWQVSGDNWARAHRRGRQAGSRPLFRTTLEPPLGLSVAKAPCMSTLAAALLVLLARTHGMQLSCAKAGRAVAAAGGERVPSVPTVSAMVCTCEAQWQVSKGGPAKKELLVL